MYASKATTPWWAVEKIGGLNVSDVQPIWGLVVDEFEHDLGLWTNNHDSMYLPVSSSAAMASLSIPTYSASTAP